MLHILLTLCLAAGEIQPPVTVPVLPDAPAGYPDKPGALIRPQRQDLTTLELVAREGGRHDLILAGGESRYALEGVDLGLFVPRIPAAARADDDLVRYALFQREFNRNEVRMGRAGDADEVRIANNCLRRGLWEVMLDRRTEGGSALFFHGWLDFPREEYAAIFQRVNGRTLDQLEAMLTPYPVIDGLAAPIERLRTTKSESAVAVRAVLDESPIRFGEQRRKAGLVVSAQPQHYRQFADPARQPVQFASFQEPGLYDRSRPVSMDLAWTARPVRAVVREVEAAPHAERVPEFEVVFENGHRLVFADRALRGLVPRTSPPQSDADTLRLTFGIGTPDIYATRAERERELAEDRPSWLLLLGADGRHVDNHLAGCDRVFLWREAGSPERLHAYLVGYERIAVVAHLVLTLDPGAG